jgi:hypothetical protein
LRIKQLPSRFPAELETKSILAKVVYMRLVEWLRGARRLEVLCILTIMSFRVTIILMSRSAKRESMKFK